MLSSKTKRELKIDQRQILIDSIEIGISSPHQILSWGERLLPNGKKVGLIKNSKTVNYKRFTPFRDGLFCERIFGPVTSFVCACGKKQPHSKVTFCEKCEVEYIDARSRRYRLGYISLLSPVTHIWYLKGRPSYLSLFLGKRKKTVVALAYCNAYLIEHGISKKNDIGKSGHIWPYMQSPSNNETFFHSFNELTVQSSALFNREESLLKSNTSTTSFLGVKGTKKTNANKYLSSFKVKQSSLRFVRTCKKGDTLICRQSNALIGKSKAEECNIFKAFEKNTANTKCYFTREKVFSRANKPLLCRQELKKKYLSSEASSYGTYFYARQHTLPFLPSLVSHFYLRDALLNFIYSLASYDDFPLLEYCHIKRREPLRDVHRFMAHRTVEPFKKNIGEILLRDSLSSYKSSTDLKLRSIPRAYRASTKTEKGTPKILLEFKKAYYPNASKSTVHAAHVHKQQKAIYQNKSKVFVKGILLSKKVRRKMRCLFMLSLMKGISFNSKNNGKEGMQVGDQLKGKKKVSSFAPLRAYKNNLTKVKSNPFINLDLAMRPSTSWRPSKESCNKEKLGRSAKICKKTNQRVCMTSISNFQRQCKIIFKDVMHITFGEGYGSHRRCQEVGACTSHSPLRTSQTIKYLLIKKREEIKSGNKSLKRLKAGRGIILTPKIVRANEKTPRRFVCDLPTCTSLSKRKMCSQSLYNKVVQDAIDCPDNVDQTSLSEESNRSLLSGLELIAIREILSYTGGGALQQLLQQFNQHDLCKFLFAEAQILRRVFETQISTDTSKDTASGFPYFARDDSKSLYKFSFTQSAVHKAPYTKLRTQNAAYKASHTKLRIQSFAYKASHTKLRFGRTYVGRYERNFVKACQSKVYPLKQVKGTIAYNNSRYNSFCKIKDQKRSFESTCMANSKNYKTKQGEKGHYFQEQRVDNPQFAERSVCAHTSLLAYKKDLWFPYCAPSAVQVRKNRMHTMPGLTYTSRRFVRTTDVDMCVQSKIQALVKNEQGKASISMAKQSKSKYSTKHDDFQNKTPDLLKKQILRISRRIYKVSRRLKIAQLLTRNHRKPEWMILSHLPVLPPDLRPILQMSEKVIVASDLNIMYQRVIYRNNRHLRVRFIDFHLVTAIQRLVQDAVDRLIENGKGGLKPYYTQGGRPLKSLSDILKGKKGRFRLNLLGKRVDFSGRSVIVVSPLCQIHECGLPKDIALELYHYFLLRQLIVKKYCSSIVTAKKMIKSKSSLMWDILRLLMYHHPVLLNRAPTLHRLGIQAFQPKLVLGNAILLHPLVCSGFNADFDGDQMGVHLPLSFAARAESWDLLWSRNNLLSPATGQPMLVPSQDMVLGFYYITAQAYKSSYKGKTLFASARTGATHTHGLLQDCLYEPSPSPKVMCTAPSLSSSKNKRLRLHSKKSDYSSLLDYEQSQKIKTNSFLSLKEITTSLQSGKIKLHHPVWLQWRGQIENEESSQKPLELRVHGFGVQQEVYEKYVSLAFFTKNKKQSENKKLLNTQPFKTEIKACSSLCINKSLDSRMAAEHKGKTFAFTDCSNLFKKKSTRLQKQKQQICLKPEAYYVRTTAGRVLMNNLITF